MRDFFYNERKHQLLLMLLPINSAISTPARRRRSAGAVGSAGDDMGGRPRPQHGLTPAPLRLREHVVGGQTTAASRALQREPDKPT